MKKIFLLFSSVAVLSLVACGPSDEEKKVQAQRLRDSLEMDSIQKAEAAKMMNEMAAPVDSIVLDTTMNQNQ